MIPAALYEVADRVMAMLPDSFKGMIQSMVRGTPGALGFCVGSNASPRWSTELRAPYNRWDVPARDRLLARAA